MHIREIRKRIVTDFSTTDECDAYNSFLSENDMKNAIRKMEELLNTTGSYDIKENVNGTLLKDAAEMFIYLQFCPKPLTKSPWRDFYANLLMNSSPKLIISTLNRILKSSELETGNGKNVPEKLLEKIRENLQLQHKNIKIMTKDRDILVNKNDKEYQCMIGKVGDASECSFMNLLSSSLLQKLTSHPVHIIDDHGKFSPSSFIPFCGIGRSMSILGKKIDQFEVPICNSFKQTVLLNQVCYELDVTKVINGSNVEEALKLGLTLILDYIEDRQVKYSKQQLQKKDENILDFLVQNDDKEQALIYLNTIGMIRIMAKCTQSFFFRASQAVWRRRVQSECSKTNQSNIRLSFS